MLANEVYQQTVKFMPAAERLRLASLILNDLVPAEGTVDESGEWTDEDIADLNRATWAHIEEELGNDDATPQ